MSDEKYIVYHIQSNVVDSKVVFSCFSSPYCSVLCWWKRKAFQSVILGRPPLSGFYSSCPLKWGLFLAAICERAILYSTATEIKRKIN